MIREPTQASGRDNDADHEAERNRRDRDNDREDNAGENEIQVTCDYVERHDPTNPGRVEADRTSSGRSAAEV